jgi:glycyl-tRNA synthetase beta chain
MKADLLFELGTEELPPKVLMNLSDALVEGMQKGLGEHKLTFGQVDSFAAPRRLAIIVKSLEIRTPDTESVSWGPPVKVAFDADGNPTKAAQAFASKNGIDVSELSDKVESDGKQDKLCARRVETGKNTTSLLGGIIEQTLAALPIPKRMKWGDSKEEFVRPVQWAVLLFNGETCKEHILGVTTGNISQGHRFHGSGDIVIRSPDSYEQQLHDGFVLASFDKRRALIKDGVSTLAKGVGGNAVIDEALLDEVTGLNEWPVPLIGRFDEAFLSVPSEALVSSMKEHQKYFHVVDSQSELMPAFITVANIVSKDPQQVIEGNERVIRPRLADAAFFYKNDARVSLHERREQLKKVVFQEKLGSVFAKTERVATLAKRLSVEAGADPRLAYRAGQLCKSDLVTDMVGEFTDLQGVMGRYYALNDGEDPQVADALLEQYMPRFAGDMVPATAVGAALALADKLDTLVGIFSIGQQPSGSRDPFALRRASLGLLRIIIDRKLDVDLRAAIEGSASQFKLEDEALQTICKQVLAYILDRFKSWYKEEGFSTEIYLSVAPLNLGNPLDIDARVNAVAAFSLLAEADDLAAANKRVSNILTKQLGTKTPEPMNISLLVEPAEKALAESITGLASLSVPLLEDRDYTRVLQHLATLRDPIDDFFNEVMVMVDDQALRNNRLSLLSDLRTLFINVADISQMDSKK